MDFKVDFHVSDQTFKPDFDKVNNISDGGYERGYNAGHVDGEAAGYKVGRTDGYAQGYTEGEEVGRAPFNYLANGTIVEAYSDKITSICEYAFYNKTKLTKVDFPNVITVMQNSFYGCTALADINFPALVTINQHAFRNCTKLKSAEMPQLVTCNYGFQGCTALNSIYMPKLKTIGASAFNGCAALKEADLPSVTSIAYNSFINTGLVCFILRNTSVCTLAGAAFAGTPIAKGIGFIYVPDNLVEKYKTADNWETYADMIKPLSELDD